MYTKHFNKKRAFQKLSLLDWRTIDSLFWILFVAPHKVIISMEAGDIIDDDDSQF